MLDIILNSTAFAWFSVALLIWIMLWLNMPFLAFISWLWDKLEKRRKR